MFVGSRVLVGLGSQAVIGPDTETFEALGCEALLDVDSGAQQVTSGTSPTPIAVTAVTGCASVV